MKLAALRFYALILLAPIASTVAIGCGSTLSEVKSYVSAAEAACNGVVLVSAPTYVPLCATAAEIADAIAALTAAKGATAAAAPITNAAIAAKIVEMRAAKSGK